MPITIDINPYIGLAIVGMFSGIGSALGQYLFKEIIKPKIHPITQKINGGHKKKKKKDKKKKEQEGETNE